MINLRYYQYEAKQALYNYWENTPDGNAILSLATGTGKSVIIADITKDVIQKRDNTRVIILSHVAEILAQNAKKLYDLWGDAPVGVYSASLQKKQVGTRIIVAGIQSVHRKANVMGWFDLVIIDEVHLLSDKDQGMYRNFIKALQLINPKLRILGLSATPWRTKGGLLTEGEIPLFDDIVYTYTMKQAISDGYLSSVISKHSLIQADLSGVHTVMGDFHQGEMEGAFRNQYLVQQAAEEIIRLGHDRLAWLLFSSGIDHAYDLRDALLDKGIEAVTITGQTDTLQREGILRMFSNGEKYRAITNYGVLTTGTDIPRIDLVATLFGTKSSGKLLQCVGRGLRLSPETSKRNCLFLDYGSNLERFGCCLDELGAPSQRKKREDQEMPMKVCPKCQSVHPISTLECGDCGYIFPIDTTYKHDPKATNAAAMSSERMNGEWYEIESVEYAEHIGRNEKIENPDGTTTTHKKPNTLKVTYNTPSDNQYQRLFREWVCINHDGYARTKAKQWLEKRMVFEHELPIHEKYALIEAFSIQDAITIPDILLEPRRIRVRKNGKYEEIVEYDF